MRQSILFLLSVLSCTSNAQLPWPQKTGPAGDGTVSAGDAKNLPLEWDEASGKNIQWKIPLQGFGHCTPVIGEGRVWLTAASEDGKQQFVYCIDQQTGEVLHHKLLFENEHPEDLANPINNYAAPSSVLEPGAVYVHFGTYGTAKLDSQTAEVIWQRRDINVRHFRGPGSSPILFDGMLILTFDGIDHQFVTALDTKTGKTLWKTDRTTDYKDLDGEGKPKREGDMRKAYGTPSVAMVDGKPQLISIGSMAAFGYDAYTGEEIWTITHDDMNAAAQPLLFKNLAIMNTGDRSASFLAVRLDGTTKGNVDSSHVAWMRPKGNSRLSYPVLVGSRVVFVTDTGVVVCVEAETGEMIWTGRIGGNHIASPIVANGLIYFFTIEGDTIVIEAEADELKIVQQNKLAEGMRASPAVASSAFFLRTHGHLYKIAESE
ncbi:MAG: PQQ-binding-like beta-propeller repeat protein [Pirellulaceae bacterium]